MRASYEDLGGTQGMLEALSHLGGLFADAVKCVKTTSSTGDSAYEMGTGWTGGALGGRTGR